MKSIFRLLLPFFITSPALSLGLPTFPPARPDIAPQLPSPFTRCEQPLKARTADELFVCAESEFWHGFTDGRLKVRQETQDILGQILELTKTNADMKKQGRVYALRGYLRLALALENGRINHLILGTMEKDFHQAKAWDSENKIYDTFLDTIVMAKAAVFGNWDKAVATAIPAFDILAEQPVNILALSGTTIGFPLTTGIPQKTIEILDAFTCPEDIAGFCYDNTLHAAYARPGLNFHFAEAYARMGNTDKARAYFELAKTSPGFSTWAYKDLVLKPLADMENYMNYWKAFKQDESLINKVYANQNYGCLLCHGR